MQPLRPKPFNRAAALPAVVLLGAMLPHGAFADGTETLGPPTLTLAQGDSIIAAGTGLALGQPQTIDITIPEGASVEQVLVYWEGTACAAPVNAGTDDFCKSSDDSAILLDDSIVLNGIDVNGMLIGGPTPVRTGGQFGRNVFNWTATHRADVTGTIQLEEGANSVAVSGLEYDWANNGAGLLVVIDDDMGDSHIDLVDGSDFAFAEFTGTRLVTVPQTFDFTASNRDREATLSMFFSSVQGETSTGDQRSSVIEVEVDGVTTVFINDLNSNDGDEWDTLILDAIEIPSGADSLTVRAISENRDPESPDARPASFVWSAAGLDITSDKEKRYCKDRKRGKYGHRSGKRHYKKSGGRHYKKGGHRGHRGHHGYRGHWRR